MGRTKLTDLLVRDQIDPSYGLRATESTDLLVGRDQIDESGGWEAPNRPIYCSGGTRLMNLLAGRHQFDRFTAGRDQIDESGGWLASIKSVYLLDGKN